MFVIQFDNGTYLTLFEMRTPYIDWAKVFNDWDEANQIANALGGVVIELDDV